MSSGKDKTVADTRAPDKPDVSATSSGKLPSEARQTPIAGTATEADVADFVRRVKELALRRLWDAAGSCSPWTPP